MKRVSFLIWSSVMRGSWLALPLLSVALATGASAQPASRPAAERRIHAVPAASPVVLDGVLDEAVWQAAPPCSDFTQRDPVEGARPSQNTEVRVRYDRDALYIGARLHDSSPNLIVSELSRRDGGTRSDRCFVYLDPNLDRRSGYYFGINAAGTQFDGTLFNDGWSDDAWDGVWDGCVHRDAEGWSLEMRIPFSQLRFPHAAAQRWGINFQREMGRGFENIYFAPRPKASSGFVSEFAVLEGLQNVESTNAIEIVPFATSKAEFSPRVQGDPFHDGSN